ncbi:MULTISPECIES: CCA tRNA nucleotidyltransferase [Lysinibacillus]|jgi:tRNA nucleotidyltransferase (CCA-adding enzyme)|uniref:CCA tRNA nucleotidyltransferase n=1 Tax=Lysinibacillus TaxID=400634 RepID=UPI0004D99A2D|nr:MULTISPECIES: CCA tRNA nucleotidyltransferase [Lysinibacillus]AJK88614.1 tRNA nucleotidyltransferase [Lysinibacillus fusiformis]KHK53871.1 tRNA nucleotidyltransferase [Lysinibacillus sp. A1]MCE4043276.1 CCA tRNA nucleotidyltransferase [Lysinibacillus fusiformis]WEA40631.1 CCA tRNA nucleotidyltransferase [Lysinibacillus fusiformis]
MQNNKEWQTAYSVIEQLEQAGFEAVIVGGAVRDALLNRPAHDVDVATNALPEEVKTVFQRTVDIGIQHGTVLVIVPAGPVEVTTYRTDGEYTDHRRPDKVQFVRSLQDDLQRRDFTMNAIAMRRDGSFVDYYGGRQDIDLRIIRAVGDAKKRFAEDALRMLRAIRFSAQLDFTIAEDTLMAIQNRAADIAFIAKERIKAELDKLWLGTTVFSGLQKLEESGLAAYLQGSFQAERWYEFQTEDKHVGWAYFALLQGANWREILRDYRLSNKEMAFVKSVLTAYEALKSGWTNSHYFTYEKQELEAAIYFAKLLQADVCLPSEPIRILQDKLPIRQKQEVAVNGADLLKWSGKKGGPWVKEVLEDILEAILHNELANDRQQIKNWLDHNYFHET